VRMLLPATTTPFPSTIHATRDAPRLSPAEATASILRTKQLRGTAAMRLKHSTSRTRLYPSLTHAEAHHTDSHDHIYSLLLLPFPDLPT
jgi:hypothetical protein